jgi:hypothetical protein
MGKGCKVGQTYLREISIDSNCPATFSYEIKELKPHPDIRVTPFSGDIIGNTSTIISFSYTP